MEDAMADVDNRKVIIRKQDRIDYILGGVADYYSTTVRDIRSRRKNKYMLNRKRLAIVLLYDVADCSLKDITYSMGYCPDSLCVVFNHLKETREDMASPTEYGKKLKTEFNNLLNHLNL